MSEVLGDLERQVGHGLREFAQTTDLDPRANKPIFPIKGKGRELTSFTRALEFHPSGEHAFSIALKAFENGDPDQLKAIETQLRAIGIGVRLRVSHLGDGKCIIDEIILSAFGDIHERCGIEL